VAVLSLLMFRLKVNGAARYVTISLYSYLLINRYIPPMLAKKTFAGRTVVFFIVTVVLPLAMETIGVRP
jgi:hypothetical protein